MLVSHTHQFIFTKTVKTASTSVELLFEPYCVDESNNNLIHSGAEIINESGIVGARGGRAALATWYNHMPLSKVSELLGQDIMSNYFKFTTIRNPYTKMISLFHYLERRKQRLLLKGHFKRAEAIKINDDITSLVDRFKDWLMNGGMVIDRSKYVLNGSVSVDFFIRFEHLNDDLAKVVRQLNLPVDILSGLSHKKPGKKSDGMQVADYYDRESQDEIEKNYSWELEKFSYGL